MTEEPNNSRLSQQIDSIRDNYAKTEYVDKRVGATEARISILESQVFLQLVDKFNTILDKRLGPIENQLKELDNKMDTNNNIKEADRKSLRNLLIGVLLSFLFGTGFIYVLQFLTGILHAR
jgi:hypothetical protein